MAYERTLVQIRERGYLDLLDLTLVVVRARPVALAVAAVAGIAPFMAFNAWFMALDTWATADMEVPPAFLLFLVVLEAPWATAPLTIVLGGLMFGTRPSVWRVIATVARSFFPMLLFQTVARGVLMVSGILYLLVPIRLAFANEVILLERERWKVIRRCGQLSDQRGGEFFARWLAQMVFGVLFVCVFWEGTGVLGHALGGRELTWDEPGRSDLFDLRTQLALWLVITFFTIARFLMYIDQRIRLEGWEVELRLRAVGRALEEARPW